MLTESNVFPDPGMRLWSVALAILVSKSGGQAFDGIGSIGACRDKPDNRALDPCPDMSLRKWLRSWKLLLLFVNLGSSTDMQGPLTTILVASVCA